MCVGSHSHGVQEPTRAGDLLQQENINFPFNCGGREGHFGGHLREDNRVTNA